METWRSSMAALFSWFPPGLGTEFSALSGIGTAWPASFSLLKNPLELMGEADTLMTLVLSGKKALYIFEM